MTQKTIHLPTLTKSVILNTLLLFLSFFSIYVVSNSCSLIILFKEGEEIGQKATRRYWKRKRDSLVQGAQRGLSAFVLGQDWCCWNRNPLPSGGMYGSSHGAEWLGP